MTREILEKAFEKTKEEEVKAMKRQRIAKVIGMALGVTAALTLDALVYWAIINFMFGVTASYVMVLGGVLFVCLTAAKIKTFKL